MRAALLAVGGLLALAPSASAAELMAAYDTHVAGQGFQIGLVNAATGAQIPLPAGVNTTEDELHPTLSRDGKYLAFTRMQIVPRLDGTFLVPPTRTVLVFDLQTGQPVPFPHGAGAAGPTFHKFGVGGPVDLAYGVAPSRPEPPGADGDTRIGGSVPFSPGPLAARVHQAATLTNIDNMFVTHAGVVRSAFSEVLQGHTVCRPNCSSPRDLRMHTLVTHDPTTGAAGNPRTRLATVGMPDNSSTLASVTLRTAEFGDADGGAGHATARVDDDHIAMDRTVFGGQSDIHTLFFPADAATTQAPFPISSLADERFPAWSPDGLQLAFVRTVNGRRKLGVFDLTLGIQAIVNPLVDLGTEAPAGPVRAFQHGWGNVSLAPAPAAPAVVCDFSCRVRQATTLRPTVVTGPSKIGIFVVRRTGGTKTVLGVKQPKIKVVGRVPLGTAKQGKNRFTWDLRVNGKKLKPGQYLLTYRLLRGDKVTTVSNSVPFTVRR